MNRDEQRKLNRPAMRFYLLTAFALLILCGLPKDVSAQTQWATSGSNIYNTNTGNVGIGTTTPGVKLDVNGWIAAGSLSGYVFTDDQDTGLTSPAANKMNLVTGAVIRVHINDSGNVGIGTTTPGYKLDVNGSINATSIYQNGSPFSSSQWTTGTGNISYNSGSVGIGTTPTPGYRLHIAGNNTATGGYPLIKLQNTQAGGHSYWLYSGASSTAGDFSIYDETTGAVPILIKGSNGNVGIGFTTTQPNYKLDVNGPLNATAIYQNGSPFNSSQWTTGTGNISYSSGNVGIGTTTPTAKLDVDGNINVTGNINAKYQDVAEWVPASVVIPAGTVVILDPTRNNQVLPSAKAYDTGVAGVISERPGLVLGESGAGKVMVATTGRVKVKVDATRAPIHIGDLLVTSDEGGMAMKSEPVKVGDIGLHRPGTLIGKALEPLLQGKGEILVLLSLQ